jgi:hypothetical protein
MRWVGEAPKRSFMSVSQGQRFARPKDSTAQMRTK